MGPTSDGSTEARRRTKATTRQPGDRPASRLRASAGRGKPEQRGETRRRQSTPSRWRHRMRQTPALTAPTLAWLLTVPPAVAQTIQPQTGQSGAGTPEPQISLPLPEQVITATRVPTPLSEIPAGVTVIDRATI